MIILVDMDGVLADFEGGFLARWRERHPNSFFVPIAERRSFYIRDDYPTELHASVAAIYHTEGFFEQLPPVAGALEGIRQMHGAGYDLRICTAPITSYRYCVPEKYAWVEKNLGADFIKRIIITKDKTAIRGDILIDDRPDIEGAYIPQWRHLLFDAPYNRHVQGQPRIDWSSWRDLLGP